MTDHGYDVTLELALDCIVYLSTVDLPPTLWRGQIRDVINNQEMSAATAADPR
jgi:hypothetical protein